MKLRKDLVDELIRLEKKYRRTSDVDILPDIQNANESLRKNCKTSFDVARLIEDLAKFSHYSGKGTNEDIYKALEVFGVIVE